MKNKIEEYKERLKVCPPHDSSEFIDYLRDNNVVRLEGIEYIIIENFKYHSKENPCHTLFIKSTKEPILLSDIPVEAIFLYKDWEMVRWKKEDRSIDRFHIHFFKNGIPKEILESKLK